MKTLYSKLSLAILMLLFSTAVFAQNVLIDTKKTYPGIKTIEVDSGWLNVSYAGGTGPEVNVHAYLESNDSAQDIVFVTVGDVLKITYTKKQNNYNWNTRNKGFITITGPEQIVLDIKGSSGNLTINQISSPSTSVRLSSGNITASKLKGNLNIKATSGNLNVSDVDGNVNGGLTSGNANFLGIRGNVDYESTSGAIDADGVAGEINVSLTSGNAKLNNIGKLGLIQFTSGNIRATNAGLGENTRFSGTSGNFNVQTPSNLKAFNFSLKASSGNLKVGGSSAGKTLELDNGAATWVRGNISSGNITIVN
jgi:lia operon protein LiaG